MLIENSYTTKDQQIASLLYAQNQILNSSYWENGVCFFVFQDAPQCRDIIAKHYNGQITLTSKVVFEAIKTIKSILLNR